MKKKTWGIILLVLGVMSLLGSIANGTVAGYANGVGIPELTSLALTLGFIIGGIVLINKGK